MRHHSMHQRNQSKLQPIIWATPWEGGGGSGGGRGEGGRDGRAWSALSAGHSPERPWRWSKAMRRNLSWPCVVSDVRGVILSQGFLCKRDQENVGTHFTYTSLLHWLFKGGLNLFKKQRKRMLGQCQDWILGNGQCVVLSVHLLEHKKCLNVFWQTALYICGAPPPLFFFFSSSLSLFASCMFCVKFIKYWITPCAV